MREHSLSQAVIPMPIPPRPSTRCLLVTADLALVWPQQDVRDDPAHWQKPRLDEALESPEASFLPRGLTNADGTAALAGAASLAAARLARVLALADAIAIDIA